MSFFFSFLNFLPFVCPFTFRSVQGIMRSSGQSRREKKRCQICCRLPWTTPRPPPLSLTARQRMHQRPLAQCVTNVGTENGLCSSWTTTLSNIFYKMRNRLLAPNHAIECENFLRLIFNNIIRYRQFIHVQTGTHTHKHITMSAFVVHQQRRGTHGHTTACILSLFIFFCGQHIKIHI